MFKLRQNANRKKKTREKKNPVEEMQREKQYKLTELKNTRPLAMRVRVAEEKKAFCKVRFQKSG